MQRDDQTQYPKVKHCCLVKQN